MNASSASRLVEFCLELRLRRGSTMGSTTQSARMQRI